MRKLHVAVLLLLPAISATALSTQQSQSPAAGRSPDFSGTWRSNSTDWMDTPPGLRPARDPKTQLIVSQEKDSIRVVLVTLEDSSDNVRFSQTPLTYRFGGEWSGPFNLPPNSTVTTGAKWIENGRSLELSSVVVFQRRDGTGEFRITTTENWSLDADGALRRKIRQVLPPNRFLGSGIIERTEWFRR
jgi:hypothetical protein